MFIRWGEHNTSGKFFEIIIYYLLVIERLLKAIICYVAYAQQIIHHLFFYIYRSVDVEEVYQSHHVVKMNVVQ